MVFLETLVLDGEQFLSGVAGGALVAFVMAFFAAFMIVGLLVWIYLGFAYMAIAKKAKQKYPGLAWIPLVGPAIVAFNSAKMHWWPWLLIIIFWVPFIGQIACLVFAVYSVIWSWKLFEKVGRPGWWAILMLIPIVNLVMAGIAAWSKK